jgi:hypothetical protein
VGLCVHFAFGRECTTTPVARHTPQTHPPTHATARLTQRVHSQPSWRTHGHNHHVDVHSGLRFSPHSADGWLPTTHLHTNHHPLVRHPTCRTPTSLLKWLVKAGVGSGGEVLCRICTVHVLSRHWSDGTHGSSPDAQQQRPSQHARHHHHRLLFTGSYL